MIFIKMLKGHKEAYIYNITHFVTKAHYGTTVIYTISHEMHVQQDAGGYFYISSFMIEEHTFKTQYIYIFGENEALCVK